MIGIVGLGNPDKQYQNTYHNMGFMALDNFAKSSGLKFTKKKYKGEVAEGVVEGEKVVLLKPHTYMNLSGQAVVELKNMLKLDLSELLVIYDDIDLPVGAIRYRKSGSAGTHNGMRNITELLGSTQFARLRIGIGQDTPMPLINYVLSQVDDVTKKQLEPVFEKSNKAILSFIKLKGKIENIDFNTI